MLRFKKLYFAPAHVRMIKSGQLTAAWRLFNHAREIKVSNTVKLFDAASGACFGKAVIISIVDKRLGELDADDRAGYESYKDAETMYSRFSEFYGRPVRPGTPVRVIKFKLK